MIHLIASLFLLSTLTVRAGWVTDGVPLEPTPAPVGAAFTNDVMPVGLFLCTNSEFQVGFQDPVQPGSFVKMVGGESWGYSLKIGGGVVGEELVINCGEAGKLLVGDTPVVMPYDLGNASVQSAATANSAEYANYAGSADSANSANYANEAGSANTANYAANAGTAGNASYADSVASLSGHSVSELNNDAGYITDGFGLSVAFANEAGHAGEATHADEAGSVAYIGGHSVSELNNDAGYINDLSGVAHLASNNTWNAGTTNSFAHLNVAGSVLVRTNLSASSIKVAPVPGLTNGVWFGDGDSGFSEVSDGSMLITLNNVAKYGIGGTWLSAWTSLGFGLRSGEASSNYPNICPRYSQSLVGIGYGGSNTLSFFGGDSTPGVTISGGVLRAQSFIGDGSGLTGMGSHFLGTNAYLAVDAATTALLFIIRSPPLTNRLVLAPL